MVKSETVSKAFARQARLVLILIVLLFFAVQVIAQYALRGAAIDLTENGLYTLSPGTKQVLRDLESPVTLRFYFSQKSATGYAQLKAYAGRVEDLLSQYEARSGGKIKLITIDPEPFSEAEDEAVAQGLKGAQTAEGEAIYFGLIASDEADGRVVMPFFAQERETSLEYDLTKMIYELSRGEKPRLGIVSSLPLQFGPGGMQALAQGRLQPYAIYEQLQQFFDVTMLADDFDHIEPELDVLMLAHAATLSDQQLYAIDQYILGGGRALVFIDPFSETAFAMSAQQGPMGMPTEGPPASSNLEPLLSAWGLRLETGKVIGDLELAQRVNMGASARDPMRAVVDYVPWLGVTENYISNDDIVSAELSNVNLASAGALLPIDDAREGLTPLLTSSANAGFIDIIEVQDMPDPDRMIRELLPTGEIYWLAVRVQRVVDSAFPDGAPKSESEGDEQSKAPDNDSSELHLARSEMPINVIVIADADILEDRFWAQIQEFFGERITVPIADNARFVINAVDNLTGSDGLISLRSRGVSARPFTLVEEIRKRAEANYLLEQERLTNQLAQTEERLAALEGGSEDTALLSPAQMQEVERFRTQVIETRRALRVVQRNLRRDIDHLQNWVTALNIAAVPLILIFIAVIRGLRRRRAA